jgi:hypothetical protein
MDSMSNTLISRIEALLCTPSADDSADVRAHMEMTLTEGYARALALEADSLRIQRRIDAITTAMGEGRGEPQTKKLAKLARRLAVSEEELAGLRETLAALKERMELDPRAA